MSWRYVRRNTLLTKENLQLFYVLSIIQIALGISDFILRYFGNLLPKHRDKYVIPDLLRNLWAFMDAKSTESSSGDSDSPYYTTDYFLGGTTEMYKSSYGRPGMAMVKVR